MNIIVLIKKSSMHYAFSLFLGLSFCGTSLAQEYDPHFSCWSYYTSKEALDIDTDDLKLLNQQG
jgi:hypothetical protein